MASKLAGYVSVTWNMIRKCCFFELISINIKPNIKFILLKFMYYAYYVYFEVKLPAQS